MSAPDVADPIPEADVVVVGGCAAGVFAAVTCVEARPDLHVVVIEKGTNLLAKVRVSGGGRCNVTHACFDPRELVKHYPRGARELLGPFHRWQPRDTVQWFEARGARLKSEPDGRMFPVSDSSHTIIDCLLGSAAKAGVQFQTGVGVAGAVRTTDTETGGGSFELELSDGRRLGYRRLLLATGGLKPGPVFDAIRKFGHTITPLAPSLFTFHVTDPRLEGLQGLSVSDAVVSVPGTNYSHRGP
jgi:predicted Rossmann fold flavoprotein